jgi:hypothetical protein
MDRGIRGCRANSTASNYGCIRHEFAITPVSLIVDRLFLQALELLIDLLVHGRDGLKVAH